MTIIHLVATQSATLMVYRTSNHLYSYQILFGEWFILQPPRALSSRLYPS